MSVKHSLLALLLEGPHYGAALRPAHTLRPALPAMHVSH